jgi:hypothetical protein
MRSTFIRSAIVLVAVTLGGAVLVADVRTEQKTHASFGGALGRMVNMFGGKAAREGVVETVAVKSDRKMTTNEKTARLIDLVEEKVYDIDLDGKSYKVTTFDEIRKKMQEEQAKAKEQMAKMQEKKDEQKASEPQKKMAIDVSTKETGQTKTISGFECKEVITTVTMHEDGKTLEEAGGMVMTSDQWLTARIPAMKEVQEFDRRYFEKIAGMDAAAAAQQLAQALAMYPGLKDLMGRARVEGAKVDGTPISSVMTIDAVASAEQQKQQADSEKQQDSGGGLSGMLARKTMKKKQAEGGDAASADKSRSTIMTTTVDILSVATTVGADAVSVPAGFKEK